MTSVLRKMGKLDSMRLLTILFLTWKFALTASFNNTNTTQPSIKTPLLTNATSTLRVDRTATFQITEINTTQHPPSSTFNATTATSPKTVKSTTAENLNLTTTKVKPGSNVSKSSPAEQASTLDVNTSSLSTQASPITLKMAGYVHVNDSLDFAEKEHTLGTLLVGGSGEENGAVSHRKTEEYKTVTSKITKEKTTAPTTTVTYEFHKIALPGKSGKIEKIEDIGNKKGENSTLIHLSSTNSSLITTSNKIFKNKTSKSAATKQSSPNLNKKGTPSIVQSSTTTSTKTVTTTQGVKAGLKTIQDINDIEDFVTIGLQGLTINEWNTEIKHVMESFMLGYLSGIEASKLFNKYDHLGDNAISASNATDGIQNKSPKSLDIVYANDTPLNIDDTVFVTLYVVKKINDNNKGYLKVKGLNVIKGLKHFEETLVTNKKGTDENNLFFKLKDRMIYYLNYPPVPLGSVNKLCPVKILGPLSANKQMIVNGQALQFMQPEHVSILTGVALSICLIVILGLVVYFLTTKFRDVRPYDWPNRPRFNSWLFGASNGRRRSLFRNTIFSGGKRQRGSENVSGQNVEEEMRAINLIDGDEVNIVGEPNGQPVRSQRYGRQGTNKSFSPDQTNKQ